MGACQIVAGGVGGEKMSLVTPKHRVARDAVRKRARLLCSKQAAKRPDLFTFCCIFVNESMAILCTEKNPALLKPSWHPCTIRPHLSGTVSQDSKKSKKFLNDKAFSLAFKRTKLTAMKQSKTPMLHVQKA